MFAVSQYPKSPHIDNTMTESVRIIKCVCHGTTFAKLKRIAKERGISSTAKLQEFGLFGQNCRRCVPYVRKMLETGAVEFFEIIEESQTERPNNSTLPPRNTDTEDL